MYEVVKVLNNNTILAHRDHEEVIIMYKGIGFGKKAGEHFEIPIKQKDISCRRVIKRRTMFMILLIILNLFI